MRSATRSRATSSRAAPTSGRFRPFSGTPTSARPRSTRTSRPTPCAGSTARSTRERRRGTERPPGKTASEMSGSAAVTIRRTSYPQVDPRAAGLMHRHLVVVPPGPHDGPGRSSGGPPARAARRRPHRRDVGGGIAGNARPRPRPRSRPGAGLGRPLGRAARAPDERRRLRSAIGSGRIAPFSSSEDPEGPRASSSASPERRSGCPSPSLASWTGCQGGRERSSAPRERTATRSGSRVAAVGGLVRDLLLGRVDERTDLDLVVEGSRPRSRGRSPEASAERTLEHPRLSHGDRRPAGRPPGRPRDARGASPTGRRARLPAVEPASLAEDLGRRDFSLNALAVRLDRADWGRLVDTTGRAWAISAPGESACFTRCRSWRTRRASSARRASPRGWDAGSTTRRARLAAQAARLDVYRALSGDRLRTELELHAGRAPAPAALPRGRPARGVGPARRPRRSPGPEAVTPARRGARPAAPPTGSIPTRRSPSRLLALAEGSAAVEAWMERLALAPARRDAIRQRAPGRPEARRPPRRACADGPPRTAYCRACRS